MTFSRMIPSKFCEPSIFCEVLCVAEMRIYATLQMNTKISFEALNIRSVLLVGNYSKLSEEAQSCFELFRNELRSIEIICFDELLEKINLMLSLFEDKGTKPVSFDEDEDIPF